MNDNMKNQWDDIARDNAFYGVLSNVDMEDINNIDIESFWCSGRRDVDMILNDLQLGDTRDQRMLEIGCGLGRMTHYFSEIFNQVVAVDVSSEMLDRAKSYWNELENVEWILGSGKNITDIDDESIDFVFSFQVFQHIPDEEAVLNYLKEVARILKKGKTAFLHYRTFPEGNDLLAIKYRIQATWPEPIVRFMRYLWDVFSANDSKYVKYNRKYESWRGCAIEKSKIISLADEYNLNLVKTGSYAQGLPSRWSTYFVFSKPD